MAGLVPMLTDAAANPFIQGLVSSGLEAATERATSWSRNRSRSRGRTRSRSEPAIPAPMRFGDYPGTSQSKRQETVTDVFQTKNMCTLDIQNPTNIARDATGADEINTRERDVAVIKGFKVCCEIQNDNTSTPMYLNFAIVVPRDNLGTPGDDFFRSQAGTSRTNQFDPTALTANELHCLPINTDKYFVIKHLRYRVASDTGGTADSHQLNIDFYQPINRQLRWDDSLGTPRQDIYIMSWASFFGRNAGTVAASGDNDTSETYSRALRVVTYFADPAEYLNKRPTAYKRRRKSKYSMKKKRITGNTVAA